MDQYLGLIQDMNDAGRPELAEQLLLRGTARTIQTGRKELQATSPDSATP